MNNEYTWVNCLQEALRVCFLPDQLLLLRLLFQLFGSIEFQGEDLRTYSSWILVYIFLFTGKMFVMIYVEELHNKQAAREARPNPFLFNRYLSTAYKMAEAIAKPNCWVEVHGRWGWHLLFPQNILENSMWTWIQFHSRHLFFSYNYHIILKFAQYLFLWGGFKSRALLLEIIK